MNIEMPSKNEKENAINNIVENVLNKKNAPLKRIFSIYQSIGFKSIMMASMYCFIIGILGTLAFVVLSDIHSLFLKSFSVAPTFYLVVSVITNIKEKLNNLYELKMTYKYRIMQVVAIKMTWFSIISIGLSVISSLTLNAIITEIELINMILVALLTLLLFSVLSLIVSIKSKNIMAYAIPVSLWVFIVILPRLFKSIDIIKYINHIPLLVLMISIIILSLAYYQILTKYFIQNRKEVLLNVISQ